MAKMGIQMIEMYCKMIQDEFAPIRAELQSRESELRSKIEIEVKKDLGIYDLYQKKAEFQAKLDEINRQLIGWERKEHTPIGYLSPIEHRVAVVLEKVRNGLFKSVNEKMNQLIWNVKLSGIDKDTKDVFDELPKIILDFKQELAKLPAPKVTKKLLKD